MPDFDEIAQVNKAFWKQQVTGGSQYTRPWLELDRALLQDFIAGKIEVLPEPYSYIYPPSILKNVSGKDVLCLAASGGQQSAVFGLLGARVTVFDLTEEQLVGDRTAASHYGYEITTLQGDMRDLSVLAENAFDLVYQAISICFIPEVREVYREVARVLRPGGRYKVEHCNPATFLCGEGSDSWDGIGYRIATPYFGGRVPDDDGDIEFRHLFSDIFNGLLECGLVIRGVWEDPRHLHHNPQAIPGTQEHWQSFVQEYFSVLAQKPKKV